MNNKKLNLLINMVRTFVGNIITKSLITVKADGGEGGNNNTEPTPSPEPNKTQINYEDLIKQARKDEKQKQYDKIQKLKGQLDTMTKNNNNNLLVIAEKDKEIEKLNNEIKKLKEDPKVSESTKKISDLTSKLEEAEKKLKDYESMDIDKIKEDAVKEALAEKEKEIEIDNYRRELIQNNPNAIPELIVGETKEQLDASVETAIKAFSNACARANINVGASAMSNIPSATPTGTGANIPGGSAGSQYTFKDLVGLDPRSEEYKKVRQALNLV